MSSVTSNVYQFGEFTLDPQNRTLKRGSEPVALTRKAFDVLLLLVEGSGRIVSKDELMQAAWPNSFVEESNLTQTVFMIRKALSETADQRYILTLQGQGYRFLVPVTQTTNGVQDIAKSPPYAEGEVVESRAPLREQAGVRSRWILIGSALLLLLLIAAVAFRRLPSRQNPIEQPSRIMLAVLPFDNFTGDEGQEYFSDGLTEEMISQLGNLDPSRVGVIARTSVMHYKHSQASITQIGQELGVQYVIEGSVRRDSERVRIAAQLIQVKDQSHLWAREYDRDLGHLLELQQDIAREVANEIEISLGGGRPVEARRLSSVARPEAKSYEAYDLYLKGIYFWNQRTAEGFRQAADYFQQAINKDPSYGRAYAGLADTFSLMSTWSIGPQNELMPKARTAALRALELDESLAEAHASLALIKENYDYDWAEAEKEFRRAIQLDPQYATGHQWYAEFLSWQGRSGEAFAEIEQARQLDPLSLIIAADRASILYYSRQYDSAVKQCRSVLELNPNFDHAQVLMIEFYLQLGRYDDALELIRLRKSRDQEPWAWAWKAAAYGRAGHMEQGRAALAKLEQVAGSRPDRNSMLLFAYAGLGEKEKVFELLRKAYSEHSNAVVKIKVDPIYDPFRGDPQFEELLGRLGLH